MSYVSDRIFAVLRELASDLEVARDRGGRWFGRHSMQPLSITDSEVLELLRLGLLEVVDWDDGPPRPRVVPDQATEAGFRPVRTRARPLYARLTTDGWARSRFGGS